MFVSFHHPSPHGLRSEAAVPACSAGWNAGNRPPGNGGGNRRRAANGTCFGTKNMKKDGKHSEIMGNMMKIDETYIIVIIIILYIYTHLGKHRRTENYIWRKL